MTSAIWTAIQFRFGIVIGSIAIAVAAWVVHHLGDEAIHFYVFADIMLSLVSMKSAVLAGWRVTIAHLILSATWIGSIYLLSPTLIAQIS